MQNIKTQSFKNKRVLLRVDFNVPLNDYQEITIKILGGLLEKITNALALGIISKVLGSVFGALKIAVLLGCLLYTSPSPRD